MATARRGRQEKEAGIFGWVCTCRSTGEEALASCFVGSLSGRRLGGGLVVRADAKLSSSYYLGSPFTKHVALDFVMVSV